MKRLNDTEVVVVQQDGYTEKKVGCLKFIVQWGNADMEELHMDPEISKYSDL